MEKKWYKVGEKDILEVGRVTTVQAGHENICLIRTENGYSALCNSCPHQGGPLGDGYLEVLDDGEQYVVCPWHAYEYHWETGKAPGGYDDITQPFEVDVRNDGVYIAVKQIDEHPYTLMDQIVETMISWGVNTVFGMVGHSNLGLANAFYKKEQENKLRYFGIRHEGAAAFAASGYAKLTHLPAACFAIAGPGSTNLLTGLWDAKLDRVPILALTGQIKSQVIGQNNFQEVPLSDAFAAVTDFSQPILKQENANALIALAIKHAIINRDVGHIIFPDDVQHLPALDDNIEKPKEGRIASPNIFPDNSACQKSVKMINESNNPAIIIGNGGRKFNDTIIQLAEKLDAPVITTFKAKGAISDDHPLSCGVLGRSGTPVASSVMVRSDLLIVFGASFSNHTSISKKVKTIQIDFDRMVLGKYHPVDLPIWSEIETFVNFLLNRVNNKKNEERKQYVAKRWRHWRRDKSKRAEGDPGDGRIANAFIFQELSNILPYDAVITVDVGNNAYSLGMYFESKEQEFLMSGYLGSIGFAYPAALGAWAAENSKDDPRKIIAIAGDGGFGQYAMEFTTAVKYEMDICLILLNNSELAKISREQRGENYHVWQTDLINPNFAEFANNCGGLGIQVDNKNDLAPAVNRALKYSGPSLVEVISSAGQL